VIILGIDPGTTRTNPLGWALLEQVGGRVLLRAADCLGRNARDPLAYLALALDDLPTPDLDGVAVEVPHLEPGKTTAALRLSEVVGVAASYAARRGVPLLRCQPSQAKLALATDGGADKAAMMRAARQQFGVSLPKDAADAVGVGLWGLGELRERQLMVLAKRR
jgi:Holliday junction resolvasome RuvABC endonuclease subunit